MKIAIIGMWHLGTIISSGLSSLNKNKIFCFDEENIINNFKKNILPINEKNISTLIKKNYKKNLFFRSNLKEISQFNILWITYDSKIGINDKSDFRYTFSKIIRVLKCAKKNALIIVSTQIPIGTIKKLENYDKRKLKKNFSFIYIPENLRLGNGLEIFLKSPSTIIGLRKLSEKKVIKNVLAGIKSKKLFVNVETAELTKHIINSYLACSITLINEISSIASQHNVPFEELEKCIKTDQRISPKAYLRPGNSFSGGTLARDINYLISENKKINSKNILLHSIIKSNQHHSKWVERSVFKENKLTSKKILQIGLSYTSGTTTLRRSLPFEIFKRLKKNNNIKIFDEYLRTKSNEINNIKKFFIKRTNKTKFDIIIIFNKDYKFKLIKNFLKKNSFIIDINNYYKNYFLKYNYKYKSLENEKN